MTMVAVTIRVSWDVGDILFDFEEPVFCISNSMGLLLFFRKRCRAHSPSPSIETLL